MLKAQAKEEYLVSFRQIVKNSGIGDSSLRWQAKKAQLRMWKMNGVRVIEIYCAINLLKFFRDIKKKPGLDAEIDRLQTLASNWENVKASGSTATI